MNKNWLVNLMDILQFIFTDRKYDIAKQLGLLYSSRIKKEKQDV